MTIETMTRCLAEEDCTVEHPGCVCPAPAEAHPESEEELGATTAEYAILTLAAVAFAGVLAVVVKSGPVQDLLTGIIEKALAG